MVLNQKGEHWRQRQMPFIYYANIRLKEERSSKWRKKEEEEQGERGPRQEEDRRSCTWVWQPNRKVNWGAGQTVPKWSSSYVKITKITILFWRLFFGHDYRIPAYPAVTCGEAVRSIAKDWNIERLELMYRARRHYNSLWRWEFGEFPRLVGRCCSYLLPKQTEGTTQIIIFKTLPMIGRPAL